MALEIRVALVNTKSSAASISILPAELGREAIAILPSTSPSRLMCLVFQNFANISDTSNLVTWMLAREPSHVWPSLSL